MIISWLIGQSISLSENLVKKLVGFWGQRGVSDLKGLHHWDLSQRVPLLEISHEVPCMILSSQEYIAGFAQVHVELMMKYKKCGSQNREPAKIVDQNEYKC